jgi:hypothetical protein
MTEVVYGCEDNAAFAAKKIMHVTYIDIICWCGERLS